MAQSETVWLGGLGARVMLGSAATGGRFSIVMHPILPRTLASPVHTHSREDEFSFVLEGDVGVRVGDREFVAKPGEIVAKPRGVPHAFWNAGEGSARILELISPAGFETYFAEAAALIASGGWGDTTARQALLDRYALVVDGASTSPMRARLGLGT